MVPEEMSMAILIWRLPKCLEKVKLLAICLRTAGFGEQPDQGAQQGHTDYTMDTKVQQTNSHKTI